MKQFGEENIIALKAEDATEEWRNTYQPPETNAQKRQKILKQLEETDTQLFRLIDDLTEFCETLGFKPNAIRKNILQQRKQLRQDLQALQ